jgi:hypothetical protein
MARIARAVARRLGMTCKTMLGASRHRPVARARQLAMMLCYDLTDASITDIARYFQRDRATVLHGIQSTRLRLASDEPQYRALRKARIALDEEFCMHDDIPLERLQIALATFRGVYRHRHTRMAKLLQAGHMTQPEVALESRRLTAVLRHAEAWVAGEGAPALPETLRFSPADLHDCLDRLADACQREGGISLPGAEHVAADLRTLAERLLLPPPGEPGAEV